MEETNNQNFTYVLLAVLLVALAGAFYLGNPESNSIQSVAAATGFAGLSLSPQTSSASAGSVVKLDIVVTDVTDLTGVQIDVNYDSSVLRYDHSAQGAFLTQNGGQTFFPATINTDTLGQVRNIVVAKTGSGVNGTGIVASVYFNATAAGSANISFGQILLSDSSGNPISSPSTVNANITITSAPAPYCGDLSCNNAETCTSCPGDCGTCPVSHGGGGGGGGGGGFIPTVKKNATINNTNTTASNSVQTQVINTESSTRIITSTAALSKKIILIDAVQPIKVVTLSKDDAPKKIILDIQETDKPDSIPSAGGVAYKYLHITSDDPELKDTELQFEVTKDWVVQNNIDPAKMKMQRFTDQWVELATSPLSESQNSYMYNTTTPGFSYFVITGEENPAAAPAPKEGKEPINIPGIASSIPFYWPIIFVVVIVGFIVLTLREVNIIKQHSQKAAEVEKKHDDELRDYVKFALTKGGSEEQVMENCRKLGWDEGKVRTMIEEVKQQPSQKK